MNIFINEEDLDVVYVVSDTFNDWSTMQVDVDPETAEEWREVIEDFRRVQAEIRSALDDSGVSFY